MLRIYFGTDELKIRTTAHAYLNEVVGSGEVYKIEPDNYQTGQIASACGAQSLFGGGEVYLIDTPSQNAELAAECFKLTTAMEQAPATFVVIEGPLLVAAKKAWSPGELIEYKAGAAEQNNPFVLAGALSDKDRRTLWFLLCAAKAKGQAAEALIGILWWQLKTLRLAATTSTAAEAGLKDFPYNKAKRALRNFKPGELERLSLSLLELYHAGHKGEQDIDLALEEWVLRG